MKKSLVLELKRKYNLYYPPEILLDLWKYDEEIIIDTLKVLFQPPSTPSQFILLGGEELLKRLEKAFCEFKMESLKI